MRKRKEKGLIIILIIIAVCLFLIMTGGPFSMKNPAEDIMLENGDRGKTENQVTDNAILGKEEQFPSNVLDKDIAVTDSLAMQEAEAAQESMAELTFLVNNFAFERSGSQLLIEVVACMLIGYLILIGPVSYFYLKKIRKMERMWFIIPVISLFFGCIILLMSNDFIIRDPYADVIKVVTPGEKAVCYGVATSPGEDSYSLYFEDSVTSLQPWAVADNYVINEERRSLTLNPDSAFEKDYFQFSMNQVQEKDFVHSIHMEEQDGAGTLYNTTGDTFTHLMLCYQDRYCILPSMDPGDESVVTADMWKKDEYGMTGNLKEELQMQAGLGADEEAVFNLAWYRHVNEGSDQLHIAGVSLEGDAGLKETGVDLISYRLFYR